MNGQSWSNVADDYFRYMEITTVQYVEQALDFANLHSKSGIKILDVACGTGAVPNVISKRFSPDVSVLATDYAQGMVDAVNNRAEKEGWKNVKAQVMDATDLTLSDASVDVVTCSFGMMFIPEAPKALSEFHRVLTPGGQAILITWLEQDLQELLLAVIAKAQGQKLPEIPWTHTWRDLHFCQEQLEAVGFKEFRGLQANGDMVVPGNDMEGFIAALVRNPSIRALLLKGMSEEKITETKNTLREMIHERYGHQDIYKLKAVANITLGVK